jgi:hypothetical protein
MLPSKKNTRGICASQSFNKPKQDSIPRRQGSAKELVEMHPVLEETVATFLLLHQLVGGRGPALLKNTLFEEEERTD